MFSYVGKGCRWARPSDRGTPQSFTTSTSSSWDHDGKGSLGELSCLLLSSFLNGVVIEAAASLLLSGQSSRDSNGGKNIDCIVSRCTLYVHKVGLILFSIGTPIMLGAHNSRLCTGYH